MPYVTCDACNGAGYLLRPDGSRATCFNCAGTGQKYEQPTQ